MKDWVTISPSKDDTTREVTLVVGSKNEGRVQRTLQLSLIAPKAENSVEDRNPKQLIQAGKGIYISNEFQKSTNEDRTSTTVVGKTNAARLEIIVTGGPGEDKGSLPEVTSYHLTNTDVVVGNGESVPSDPGKSRIYDFDFTLTYPKNTSTSDQVYKLAINAYAGPNETGPAAANPVELTISVPGAESFCMWREIGNITFPADGGLQTVWVDANTNWSLVAM